MKAPDPFHDTVCWLAAHACFPATRLERRAELLLCLAALAVAGNETGSALPRTAARPAQDAALRAHALRRSQAHFKCDNSVNV
jgi:hypothetical protein